MPDIIVVIGHDEPEEIIVHELVKRGGYILARAVVQGSDEDNSVGDVDICIEVDISVDINDCKFVWYIFKAPYLRSKDKMVNTIDELKEELGIV